MGNLALFILATIGLTNIIVYGKIFTRIRRMAYDFMCQYEPDVNYNKIKTFFVNKEENEQSWGEYLYEAAFVCYQCCGTWCGLFCGLIFLYIPFMHFLLYAFAGSFVAELSSNIMLYLDSKIEYEVSNE